MYIKTTFHVNVNLIYLALFFLVFRSFNLSVQLQLNTPWSLVYCRKSNLNILEIYLLSFNLNLDPLFCLNLEHTNFIDTLDLWCSYPYFYWLEVIIWLFYSACYSRNSHAIWSTFFMGAISFSQKHPLANVNPMGHIFKNIMFAFKFFK